MIRFETASGSQYEIRDNPREMRRVNPGNEKRADGGWVPIHAMFPTSPEVGFRVLFVLESLSNLGPDDNGNVEPEGYTYRRTTPVIRVWEEE